MSSIFNVLLGQNTGINCLLFLLNTSDTPATDRVSAKFLSGNV